MMRQFATEALKDYRHDRLPPDATAVYEIDLAGGFVHPALDIDGLFTIVISSGFGEPLSTETPRHDDESEAKQFMLGVQPLCAADYDRSIGQDCWDTYEIGELTLDAISYFVARAKLLDWVGESA